MCLSVCLFVCLFACLCLAVTKNCELLKCRCYVSCNHQQTDGNRRKVAFLLKSAGHGTQGVQVVAYYETCLLSTPAVDCWCYCAYLHCAHFYSYTTMLVCRVCAVERSRLISYDGQTGTVVACCVRKNSSLTTALKYIRH